MIFSRNLAGSQPSQYEQLLSYAKSGGSKIVRLQLDSMGMGYTNTGKLDETWAGNWDQVFDKAAESGINIIPVFAGWFDWNNGTPDYGYSTWNSNPLNKANGGPTEKPGELFQKDSLTHSLWMTWMKSLVQRWQRRENIVAWEIFSEVNIASGTTEPLGVGFIKEAASAIREADSRKRPITASLADVGEWPDFYRSDAIDFINIHPYPYSPNIDLGTKVITDVRRLLAQYNKPVMIGESGLNALAPDKEFGSGVTPGATLGLTHAIWSEMVSGAMNGRALYWEDGFAIFFQSLNWPYLEKNARLELPAVKFAAGVDFSGFKPLTAQMHGTIKGAVLGNDRMIIGWFRDGGCEPPKWPLQPVISKQNVTIIVPGSAANWQIDFYNTRTGIDILSSSTVTRNGDQVTITLPDFTDDIAFKMYIQK